MAEIKEREELRPRFANGRKPPQEDFWNWLESYWHKHDDIDAAKVKATIDGRKVDILTLMGDNETTRGVSQMQKLLRLSTQTGGDIDLSRIVNIELNLEWAEL